MSRFNVFIPLFFSFLLILSNCRDTNINPYETETGIYSVYGAMDLHETEHVIRVRDLNVFHQDSNSINLDATVTFFDLEQGTSQVLRDSIVLFPENYTHNFLLNKEFSPRSPYKVVVERSDGESVSSMFTTPGVTEATTLPRKNLLCSAKFNIRFRNVTPSEQIRWEVGFFYNNKIHWLELSGECTERYYPDRNELVITVSTHELLTMVFPTGTPICGKGPFFPEIYCRDLQSNRVFLRYTHLGSEWQKVYPIRPVNPVYVGDVENGLGFLGAFRRDTLSYTVIPD